MANIKIGGLAMLIGIVVGGLIVAWTMGLGWAEGIFSVALILGAFIVAGLVAIFLPIGNMMIRVVAFCVVLALIVLWGFSYLGVV